MSFGGDKASEGHKASQRWASLSQLWNFAGFSGFLDVLGLSVEPQTSPGYELDEIPHLQLQKHNAH